MKDVGSTLLDEELDNGGFLSKMTDEVFKGWLVLVAMLLHIACVLFLADFGANARIREALIIAPKCYALDLVDVV